MTKKSMARLQRDAQEREVQDARKVVAGQIAGNTLYDDIHETYESCGQVLIGYANGFNGLNIKQAVPMFSPEQKEKVDTLAIGFHTDIKTLQEDLLGIHKPFVGKTGGEMNVDTYIAVVEVSEQFAEFVGRSKGVLDPTFRSLAAEVSSVQTSPAQDPAVITDVEVKQENVPA